MRLINNTQFRLSLSVATIIFIGSCLSLNAAYAETQAETKTTTTKKSEHEKPVSRFWDLTDLYPSVEAWNKHREKIAEDIPGLQTCKGKLTKNAQYLAKCLTDVSETYKQVMRLFSYAFLAKDTNLGDSAFRERLSMAQTLYSQVAEATSYIDPELAETDENKMLQYVAEYPELSDFDFYIINMLRRTSHILSEEEEKLLATLSDPLMSVSSAYEVLTNAEIPWPEITLSDGTTVTLNAQGYTKYRNTPNREDRKLIFDQFFGTYQKFKQTLGITLEGQVKQQVLLAKLRHFDSAMASALFQDNIPPDVYLNLVKTVNDNLSTLHRLVAIRQGLLKQDESAYYDVYPSVIDMDLSYSLEAARDITFEAFKPLGDAYLEKFRQAVNSNWMHASPAEGKTSGAYVMGAAYDVHPYVLLNHQDDIDSLSTFAHEWGHAMHSLLSNENQPFTKADYATFTAEIASTLNEVLLFDYLRSQAKTDQQKLFFLFKELDQLRGTFFRQTQFAEFELAIHQEVEAGGALSGDKLNLIYGDILKRYYGQAQGVMDINDTYTVEWAYIPHFYRNFYVYQYATSISAAYYLADKIKSGGETAQQQYLDILRAGGSDYPYEILKKAGVDMAQPQVYQAVIDRANRLMDEVVQILGNTE